MNEIEEYLLMIFMENDSYISKSRFDYCLDGKSHHWEQFKKEELGRTLPETYEYYASDYAVMCMRAHEVIDIHLTKKPLDRWKNKIKITVVEDD